MYRFLQFRLRTLLILIALVAGATRGAEWWFRPFVIEERWDDGNIKSRYRARYDWRGNIIARGEQTEYHANGQMARRWLKWSGTPGGECGEGCEHWSEVGSPLKHGERDFDSLIDLIASTIRVEPAWLVEQVETVEPAIATGP